MLLYIYIFFFFSSITGEKDAHEKKSLKLMLFIIHSSRNICEWMVRRTKKDSLLMFYQQCSILYHTTSAYPVLHELFF